MSYPPILKILSDHLEQPPTASAAELLRGALQLNEAERETIVAEIIDALDAGAADDQPEQVSLDWAELIAAGYRDVPLLAPDLETDSLLARQTEMMGACFEPIGEEHKPEKREGLAAQQIDIEQRHALRLALGFHTPAELSAHLARCLAEPAFGYGERGDNGRTIAQALQTVAGDSGVDFAAAVEAWWHAPDLTAFRRDALAGVPFSFRSLFDAATLTAFTPIVVRLGDQAWRLGLEGHGKYRDFAGDWLAIWPALCDTFVAWHDEDNAGWLADLKARANRFPDTFQRAAWADRLAKETWSVRPEGNRIRLDVARLKNAWPRATVIGQSVGLTRLSGHGMFELAWEGGASHRRFELSNTTRDSIPLEHIEIAHKLAEVLAAETGDTPAPAMPDEVEAAWLRRLKVDGAELGPPGDLDGVKGSGEPAAGYRVAGLTVTLLRGGDDLAFGGDGERGVLLRRNEKRDWIEALPVRRGRAATKPIATTPLAELEPVSRWRRALCAWNAFLVKSEE